MATKVELRKAANEFIEKLELKEKGEPIILDDDATSDELMALVGGAVKILEPGDEFTPETEKVITEFEATGITNKRMREKQKSEKVDKRAKPDLVSKVKEKTQQEVADKIHEGNIEEASVKTKVEEDEPLETGLKINDKFHAACPVLSPDELQKLEELILKDGMIYSPIITWNGFIVDGHNRFEIAQKHNIPFVTEEKKFKNEDEAIIWIKENAISQRNLTDFAKFELVKDIEIMLKHIGKKKQADKTKKDEKIEKHDTRKILAKKAGISPTQVAKAKVIDKEADEKTKEELRKGKTTIGKVYDKVKPVVKGKRKDGFNTIKMENGSRKLGEWVKMYEKDDEMKKYTPAVKDIIVLIDDRIKELRELGK